MVGFLIAIQKVRVRFPYPTYYCEVDKLVKSPAFEAGVIGGSKPSFAVNPKFHTLETRYNDRRLRPYACCKPVGLTSFKRGYPTKCAEGKTSRQRLYLVSSVWRNGNAVDCESTNEGSIPSMLIKRMFTVLFNSLKRNCPQRCGEDKWLSCLAHNQEIEGSTPSTVI